MRKIVKQISYLCVILLTNACTSHAIRIDNIANKYDFNKQLIHAKGFRHAVYNNTAFTNPNNLSSTGPKSLHIYLEGDGTPWIKRIFPSIDPTSRSPLMLKLMAQDKLASIYIGRPCYHGFHNDPACNNSLWTSHRYSATVLNSMLDVIKQLQTGYDSITLIGHSGGGTLAMLLASNIDNISSVITLAGNIDTDAWTKHHGYAALSGSINPAKNPPLTLDIKQIHLLAEQDRVIPADISRQALLKQGNKTVLSYPNFNHSCCWSKIWPEILKKIP